MVLGSSFYGKIVTLRDITFLNISFSTYIHHYFTLDAASTKTYEKLAPSVVTLQIVSTFFAKTGL